MPPSQWPLAQLARVAGLHPTLEKVLPNSLPAGESVAVGPPESAQIMTRSGVILSALRKQTHVHCSDGQHSSSAIIIDWELPSVTQAQLQAQTQTQEMTR